MQSVKTIRSVDRTFQVLEAMTTAGPCSLGRLHALTGLDRATILRILRTLGEGGYILRSLATGRYEPTPRLAQLGRGVRLESQFTEAAADILDRLCRDVVWPSDIGLPRDGVIEIIETSRTLTPFIMNPAVHAMPISMVHSAMGQAYLAWCSEEEREQAIERIQVRRVEGYAVRRAEVDKVVGETQARGYGVRMPGYTALPGSWNDQLRALAIPVMVAGHAVAALNVVWVAQYASVEAMAEQHLDRLREAAAELAGRLAPPTPRSA